MSVFPISTLGDIQREFSLAELNLLTLLQRLKIKGQFLN